MDNQEIYAYKHCRRFVVARLSYFFKSALLLLKLKIVHEIQSTTNRVDEV